MNRISFLKFGLVGILQFFAVAGLSAAPGAASAESASSERPVMRLDDFLWREVQNADGNVLGSVSDVLVHLPSGRIAFVAVRTPELFDRPRAVTREMIAFGDTPDAPLRVNVSEEQWLNAPQLDWNAQRVITPTLEGARVLGYHQQAWLPPVVGEAGDNEPADRESPAAVATRPGSGDAEQYVALSELILDRVMTPATEQPGFMRDFVLDWSVDRATYALVSTGFTPIVSSNEKWFAIPVALLGPPVDLQAIAVMSDEETFRRAQDAAAMAALPENNSTQIYLYPPAADEAPEHVVMAEGENAAAKTRAAE